jgi:hypothetical protein
VLFVLDLIIGASTAKVSIRASNSNSPSKGDLIIVKEYNAIVSRVRKVGEIYEVKFKYTTANGTTAKSEQSWTRDWRFKVTHDELCYGCKNPSTEEDGKLY